MLTNNEINELLRRIPLKKVENKYSYSLSTSALALISCFLVVVVDFVVERKK